jgi:uncharacterized protein YjbI with pentapeptide repeats/energy-coupling factor transporter ATP-binding protein EcfA2
MIVPQRAPVKPRVYSAEGGAAFPLEDEVQQFLEAGARGILAVLGPAGSGKTTALQHLAAVLPHPERVAFLDEPGLQNVFQLFMEERYGLAVLAASREQLVALTPIGLLATYRLAPWTEDDRIEYLLSVHRPRCASVMKRLGAADSSFPGGNPELWRIVLDRLAGDEALLDVRGALHQYLEAQLSDTDLLERARSACLNALLAPNADLPAVLEKLARPGFAGELIRALRHHPAQLLLAAERVAADLHGDGACDYLAKRLPRELVRSAAQFLAHDGRALDHLHRLLQGPSWSHAMAVSLLHASGRSWLLQANCPRTLAGAYLEKAPLSRVDLSRASLIEADLTSANLQEANLTSAVAHRALFHAALLQSATLDALQALEGDFSRANLSGARAESAWFESANLEGADFSAATLRAASFVGANLTRADFRGANLAGAFFPGAELKEADFAGASLHGATLSGLSLRGANWEGAYFARALLKGCDLEGLLLPAACFEGADLEGAYLTGSVMPDASFRYACLRGAGLADIDWERADLRDADLIGATFHMGSSRSGLVGSPIACEGSRTGFYTDDYDDQTYKPPEEIRKANLCGADLRGARLDGVDFYLVDLRGACYDLEQEPHLRRSGAILEAHCS